MKIVFPLIIRGYLASDNMMDMDDMNEPEVPPDQ